MKHSRSHGFTLVEIAIVIVIIGLLVGGVLVGRDMMRSAEISSILGDVEAYTRAIEDFETKYGVLPGDIPDATGIWTACVDAAGPPVNNCNGDGNGTIDTISESIRAWQHMSLSGSLTSGFDGAIPAAGDYLSPPNNVPEADISNAVYSLFFNPSGVSGRHELIFGRRDTTTTNDILPSESVLTPIELQGVDRKIDDGLAGSGTVIGVNGVGTTACLDTGEYDLLIETPECIAYFVVHE